MKPRKILIPLDGSALAESAIALATEVAGQNPTFMLLRAAEAHTLPGADPTEAQAEIVRQAENYLAGIATRLKRQGAERVETSVWYGPAESAIVEAARLRKAELIVMSTHGRSGLGRLILGSVAESVVRGTTTPILLFREPSAPVATPGDVGRARPTKEAAHV